MCFEQFPLFLRINSIILKEESIDLIDKEIICLHNIVLAAMYAFALIYPPIALIQYSKVSFKYKIFFWKDF